MFYITAHTVTQNQFANIDTDYKLPNSNPFAVCSHPVGPFGLVGANEKKSPITLLPNQLNTFENTNKLPEKDFDLHEIIIADGLGWVVILIFQNRIFEIPNVKIKTNENNFQVSKHINDIELISFSEDTQTPSAVRNRCWVTVTQGKLLFGAVIRSLW